MRNKKVGFACALAVAAQILIGCATPPEVKEKEARFESTIPVCTGEADCEAMWEAARLWVTQNAGYPIEQMGKYTIETRRPRKDDPPKYDSALAVRVRKEFLSANRYKIVAFAWCKSLLGCSPDRLDAQLDFNRKVGAPER